MVDMEESMEVLILDMDTVLVAGVDITDMYMEDTDYLEH